VKEEITPLNRKRIFFVAVGYCQLSMAITAVFISAGLRKFVSP
jgi:hypothetical protein